MISPGLSAASVLRTGTPCQPFGDTRHSRDAVCSFAASGLAANTAEAHASAHLPRNAPAATFRAEDAAQGPRLLQIGSAQAKAPPLHTPRPLGRACGAEPWKASRRPHGAPSPQTDRHAPVSVLFPTDLNKNRNKTFFLNLFSNRKPKPSSSAGTHGTRCPRQSMTVAGRHRQREFAEPAHAKSRRRQTPILSLRDGVFPLGGALAPWGGRLARHHHRATRRVAKSQFRRKRLTVYNESGIPDGKPHREERPPPHPLSAFWPPPKG